MYVQTLHIAKVGKILEIQVGSLENLLFNGKTVEKTPTNICKSHFFSRQLY
jgi:hypothetical protein